MADENEHDGVKKSDPITEFPPKPPQPGRELVPKTDLVPQVEWTPQTEFKAEMELTPTAELKSEVQETQAQEFYGMIYDLRVSYTREVDARIRRLDQLIGSAHHLSVGTYKEQVIKAQIEAVTPKKYSVNTGFVVGSNGGKIIRSKQIDILIWDSTNFAPIIQAGDFVTIQPDALRAAIEVKGMLDHEELEEAINNLESLTPFVQDIMDFHPHLNKQRFPFTRFLVAGDIDETKDGKEKLIFPDSLWNKLRGKYLDRDIESRLGWCHDWNHLTAMAFIDGFAVLGSGYIGTRVHARKPALVSFVALNKVSTADPKEEDQSIGILRAELELALTHPHYYSSQIMTTIPHGPSQLVLPYNEGTARLVGSTFKPRKPTERKAKIAERDSDAARDKDAATSVEAKPDSSGSVNP